jgi:DNA-binding CsgD family transcriptional regulator
MSDQEYETLWHYSERFTRCKIGRSELVTMAWQEGERLGNRCTPGLMKSHMHFRSKELFKRSAFPLGEVGKKKSDVFNYPKVSIDAPMNSEDHNTLGEFLLPLKTTPLDVCIANNFLDALTLSETNVLNDISAGYTVKEILSRQHITNPQFKSYRKTLQEKAVEYLM